MTSNWKTVRVFISSTFRDMHAERDHLVKRVFPRLRQWCQERRLHLIDIDLRWGVTKEEADNGAAIDICLKEIDGSRPFFVCILGNRYGWVPDSLPPEELYAFHGLQADTHLSITHLEVRHAAIQSIPTTSGQTKSVCKHAFFYFRDPHCVPAPETLTAINDHQRREYQEAFFEPILKREQMLVDLRNEIRERYAADNRVFDYAGRWDAEADNPEDELLKGRLVDQSLATLGSRVEMDLRRGISEQFAEHIAALGAPDDPLASEASDHEAFIERRTQVHVARVDVERQLDEYIDGDDRRPLILSGPPGSGKSAILAHWVRERIREEGERTKAARTVPADSSDLSPSYSRFILPRFIGASTNSVNLARLLGNVCGELQRHFELTEAVEEGGTGGGGQSAQRKMEVPADPARIQQKWPTFLRAAADKGRVIIVLDAINQLDRSTDPMRLSWLPRELPNNVRIVASVLDHGPISAADYTPKQNDPLDWLAALRRMKLPEARVPKLTADERRTMIQKVPSVFCKSLDETQITELLNNQATSNPLFSFVALEELRVYGGYGKKGERLLQAIHHLPWLEDRAANDHRAVAGLQTDSPGPANGLHQVAKTLAKSPAGAAIVTTIDDALDALFGQILCRLERETDRQAAGLSSTVFRLLAAARDGLSEEELSGVLARTLPTVDQESRDGEMQAVLRQVRPYLVSKGVGQRLSELDNPPPAFDTQAAADEVVPPARQVVLLDFYHRSFWKAVRAKYVQTEDAQAKCHRELADYFQDVEQQPYFWESVESQRNRAKRLPPTPRPGNVRKVIELPYHLLEVAKLIGKDNPQAPEWDAVADLLTDWQFLEAKVEAS